MTKYTDIIERLEKATDSDRELDAAIFCAANAGYTLGKNQLGGTVILKDVFRWRIDEAVPLYTASIDAATALAERVVAIEGRKLICFFCAGGQLTPWNADNGSPDYHPKAKIDNSVTVGWMAHIRFYNSDGTSIGHDDYSHGRTAPLAILLALFRALEAKETA